MVGLWLWIGKIQKINFVDGLFLGLGKNRHPLWLVWQNGENTHCGRPLVMVSSKIEKNALCGRALVRAHIYKTPFVVGP